MNGGLWGSAVPAPAVLLSPAELLLPGLLCLPHSGRAPPRTPPGPPKPEAKTIVPAPAPTPPGPQEVDVSTPCVTPDPHANPTPQYSPPECSLSLLGCPPSQSVPLLPKGCPPVLGVPCHPGHPPLLGALGSPPLAPW